MEEKKYELIKFKDGEFSLDVNVSPKDASIWLTQSQIAELFGKSPSTVNEHIKNILKEELDESNVIRKFGKTELSSVKTKPKTFYNLDVILCVGYRVNSKRGILFRRWANQVLKQYLLNGYAINEERCITCQNQIISLRNDIDLLNEKINLLNNVAFINNEVLFKKGDIIEAFILIKKILFLAKKEIIIIDPYADMFLLHLLDDININVTIYTKKKYNIEYKKDNINIIYKEEIHDRFIIVDDLIFSIGTSINSIGKSEFIIKRIKGITKENIININ